MAAAQAEAETRSFFRDVYGWMPGLAATGAAAWFVASDPTLVLSMCSSTWLTPSDRTAAVRVESVYGSHPRRCRGEPAATRTVGEVTCGGSSVAPVLRERGAAHAVEHRRHPPWGPRSDRAPLPASAGRAACRPRIYRHRHVPRTRPAEQSIRPRADPARDSARRPGRPRTAQPAAVSDRAVRHLQGGRRRSPGEPPVPRRRPRARARRLRRAGRSSRSRGSIGRSTRSAPARRSSTSC